MKKVLITGENSFIGTSLQNWLIRNPNEYQVYSIDMNGVSWKEFDFSQYDVVFHVAGIAHINETKINQSLYYKVNRDLAYETAKKAKEEGIKQFIFLSSMSVYGIENGVIDNSSPCKPRSSYGKSKLEAEGLINELNSDAFIVATLRPPLVYGRYSKGNYPKLAKLALSTPFFPKVDNSRSMIYIDNLSEFVKQIIDNKSGGLFFPQNAEYVNTSEMVRLIAEVNGKQILMTKLFNPLLMQLRLGLVSKVFGNLVYDMRMSEYENDYRVCGFRESIEKTEMR